MKAKWFPVLAVLAVLTALSLACTLTGKKAAAPQPAQPDNPAAQPDIASGSDEHSDGESGSETSFPLPDAKIEGLTELGNGQINYQVKMSLDKVIQFYRQEFKNRGLTEREILFSQTDSTFSMVFDGDPGGKALVIQGVAIQDLTNVNIRHEDI
ncbi:MAG: hypothetical protein IT308_09760 [Anaerolineaceae bacterium]|nr:hypothetical protein [Anaerolineaceae bacterium]